MHMFYFPFPPMENYTEGRVPSLAVITLKKTNNVQQQDICWWINNISLLKLTFLQITTAIKNLNFCGPFCSKAVSATVEGVL